MSAILDEARKWVGKLHDGPDVPRLAADIAAVFPDLKSYCAQATASTAWCGIFQAWLLSKFKLRGPGPNSAGTGFMYVDRWADNDWGGTRIEPGQEQPGDIIALRSPHHVTMLIAVEGDHYRCVGGNQHDGVTEATFARSGLMAVMRPPDPIAVPVDRPAVTSTRRLEICLPRVLAHEGGNVDDPRDPGGRTSRGITQRNWDAWRQSHPGLPADVWQAPQADVLAIYRQNYWGVLDCDKLPIGVDYAVFDYGVNSGNSRAARALQQIVGTDADGEIGPLTIAAAARMNAAATVNALCDQRLAFLQGLSTWATYHNGWTNRVRDVRNDALADTRSIPSPEIQPMPDTQPSSGQVTVIPPNPFMGLLDKLKHTLIAQARADMAAHPEHAQQILDGLLAKLDTLGSSPGDASAQSDPLLAIVQQLLASKAAPAAPAASAAPAAAPAAAAPGLGSMILAALGGASGATAWTGVATLAINLALNAFGLVGSPVGPGSSATGQLMAGGGALGILTGLLGNLFGQKK